MGNFIDLTGRKFGRLTVLERVNNKTGNRYKWKCLCDCKNVVLIDPKNLKNGHTKSCGCLQSEIASRTIKKANTLYKNKYIVGKTNVARISKKNKDKNNKSGYTGVHFHYQSKTWEARIEFKGKRYYLGRHKELQDAIDARKEAENLMHGEFLEWYENEYKKNKTKKIK